MSRLIVLREETPESLAGEVASRPELLLMTDYDGTLVPLKERPELAVAGPMLLKSIKRIVKKPGVKLAIVSGRDVDELRKLLPVKELFYAGCHGAEIEGPSGKQFTAVDGKMLVPVLEEIASKAVDSIKGKNGFFVECKKASVALHYRLAHPVAALKVLDEFVMAARPLVTEHELEFIAGKKVIEVRPKVVNKGEAVKYLTSLYSSYYPVYIGDDVSDEDAFRAVQEKGLGVLVSPSKRVTAASRWLRGPGKVIRFLQLLAQ
ncbi:trehalose-phosphatase [Zhaonella formicivorans]|uniref:trehalose-phosphatase n=1 Tax=Zhaonella formicivorans TaxID=2528593 RepID=UPI001D11E010|nr:trehalose-phosphatase [Zhaonella formicivorans]